jgi:membrane fusion protein, multidrug efflux system
MVFPARDFRRCCFQRRLFNVKTVCVIHLFIVLSIIPVFIMSSEPLPKEELNFEATLVPVKEAVIRSRITSKVVKVNVSEGEVVKKGQPLMELDAEEAERILQLAQVTYDRRKIEHEKALADFEKTKVLKENNSASDEEFKNAEHGMKITELALKEAEVMLDKAKKDSESAMLRATMEGTIVSVKKSAGDTVLERDELIRIINSEELSLAAVIDSSYYGKVKTGMEVTFKTDYLKESFKTRIDKVIPFSETGKEFKITAIVANTSLRLLPGTKAACVIRLR